jgi:putative SOS response-associated peptidase YedK
VRREGDDVVRTCTVLTTSAPDELGTIHDRTPLLVPRERWAAWLDPAVAHPGDDLLVPGTAGVLDAWPVGPAVGSVRNNGPELAEPVTVPPTLLG